MVVGRLGPNRSLNQRGKDTTMDQVGTSKVFENDRIVIWELVLESGERAPRHTHRHDYVFYILEGSTLEVFDEDERLLSSFDLSAGDAFAFRCEAAELVSTDGKGLRLPVTHSARNAGPGRYREILVETKK
jgi:mannose-6-phosphate isomerase-like protein (cupin superfamily)